MDLDAFQVPVGSHGLAKGWRMVVEHSLQESNQVL